MNTVTDYFGSLVFDDRMMKATLSSDIYRSLKKTIDEGRRLDPQVAAVVAHQQLQGDLAGLIHPLTVGVDHHAVEHVVVAGGNQLVAALNLDHAYAATANLV